MSKRNGNQDTFHKRELVRVTFTDPTEFDTRFDDSDDPIGRANVGWLIEQNKQKVKLAWLYDDKDASGSAGLILPRGCNKEIIPVKANKLSS